MTDHLLNLLNGNVLGGETVQHGRFFRGGEEQDGLTALGVPRRPPYPVNVRGDILWAVHLNHPVHSRDV